MIKTQSLDPLGCICTLNQSCSNLHYTDRKSWPGSTLAFCEVSLAVVSLSRLGANHAGCIKRSSVGRQPGRCKCRDGKSCLVWVWHRFLVARKLHPFDYPCRNSRLLVDDMTRGVGRTLDLYGKFSLYHADKMYSSSSNIFCISHQLNMCRAERFQRRSSKRPWGLPLWPRSQRATFSSRYCMRWVYRICHALRLIWWDVVLSVALAGGRYMRNTSRFVFVLFFSYMFAM